MSFEDGNITHEELATYIKKMGNLRSYFSINREYNGIWGYHLSLVNSQQLLVDNDRWFYEIHLAHNFLMIYNGYSYIGFNDFMEKRLTKTSFNYDASVLSSELKEAIIQVEVMEAL